MNKSKWLVFAICALLVGFAATALAATDEEQLGQRLYFDKNLSLNQNQSCADCHLPATGFVDPLNVQDPVNSVVSLGSDVTLNGGRNAPTSGYAAFIPKFQQNKDGEYFGGQFWDGRADTLQDQAKGPFLNPVEMAMADAAAVIAAIADPQNKNYKFYKKLFASVYGIDLTDHNLDIAEAYDQTARAIAVFEQTLRFRKFSSKYDYFLAGQVELTPEERNGWEIFTANCATCHPNDVTENAAGAPVPPLLSNYSYANLGIPASDNPLITENYPDPDLGLGGRSGYETENGKFRVQSLRNIALTPPYGHNGYFATLEAMVAFLNNRADTTPEVMENVTTAVGNLGLAEPDEDALVAFLKTLSDGQTCRMPAGFALPEMTDLPELP